MLQPHIKLDSLHGANSAILPGDPGRLDHIKEYLNDVQELAYNREFRSLSGTYHGVKVIALSTGIGGSSTAIAIEELYSLGIKRLIRIGSCGALQPGIAIGDLIIATGAVRDDGTSKAYIDPIFPAVSDFSLIQHCRDYAIEQNWAHHLGIVHSHESFYIDDNAAQEKKWSKTGVLGADMETAALLTVSRLRRIKACSILNNVVVYGQDTAAAINDYVDAAAMCLQGEGREIQLALEAIRRDTAGISQE